MYSRIALYPIFRKRASKAREASIVGRNVIVLRRTERLKASFVFITVLGLSIDAEERNFHGNCRKPVFILHILTSSLLPKAVHLQLANKYEGHTSNKLNASGERLVCCSDHNIATATPLLKQDYAMVDEQDRIT